MSLNILTIALDAYIVAREQHHLVLLVVVIHGGAREVLRHTIPPIRSRLHAPVTVRLLRVQLFARLAERIGVGVEGHGRLRVRNLVVLGLLMGLILRFIRCITACDLLLMNAL